MNRFVSTLIILQFSLLAVYAQMDTTSLQQRLSDLNQSLQSAGAKEEYSKVEECMDEMIQIMQKLQMPEKEIVQRARLRIRYSLTNKRYKSAYDASKQWLETHPGDIPVLDMFATAAYRLDLGLEAKEALNKVFEADPTNPVQQRRYLTLLKETDDFEEALRVCDTIVETNPNEPRSLTLVIDAYLNYGKPDKAQSTLELLKALTPDATYIPFTEGKIHQQQNQFEEAVTSFSAIPKGDPRWFDARFFEGQCYIRQRDFAKAVPCFLDLLTENPDDSRSYTSLSQSLARMGKRKGIALLRSIGSKLAERKNILDESQFMLRGGDIAEAARLNSLVYAMQGRYRNAQQEFLQVIERLPESIVAKENLAHHYLHTYQAGKAEEMYRLLKVMVPADRREEMALNVIECQLRQGKHEPVEQFEKTLEYRSDFDQRVRSLLATYYFDFLGDSRKAIELFKSVDMLDSQLRAAYGRMWLDAGYLDEALLNLGSASLETKDPAMMMAYVQALVQNGELDKAQSTYNDTIEKNPKLSPFLRLPAEAALAKAKKEDNWKNLETKAGQAKEALQTIRTLVMQANREGWDHSVDTLLQIADIFRSNGMMEDALNVLFVAHSAAPQNASVYRQMIEAMMQPERMFERLYHIRVFHNRFDSNADFTPEIEDALSHLDLTPEYYK